MRMRETLASSLSPRLIAHLRRSEQKGQSEGEIGNESRADDGVSLKAGAADLRAGKGAKEPSQRTSPALRSDLDAVERRLASTEGCQASQETSCPDLQTSTLARMRRHDCRVYRYAGEERGTERRRAQMETTTASTDRHHPRPMFHARHWKDGTIRSELSCLTEPCSPVIMLRRTRLNEEGGATSGLWGM